MKPGGDENPQEEDLDPGIRRVVFFLRSAGFTTTDSGDGESKADAIAEGDALDYPHVAIVTRSHCLLAESDRVLAAFKSIGIDVGPAQVQGTYDPTDGSAVILVTGIDDEQMVAAADP